jgi:hypothetical protein
MAEERRVAQLPGAECYGCYRDEWRAVMQLPCQFCGIKQGGTKAYSYNGMGVCYCCWCKPLSAGKSAETCKCCQHSVARGERNGLMEHLFGPPSFVEPPVLPLVQAEDLFACTPPTEEERRVERELALLVLRRNLEEEQRLERRRLELFAPSVCHCEKPEFVGYACKLCGAPSF